MLAAPEWAQAWAGQWQPRQTLPSGPGLGLSHPQWLNPQAHVSGPGMMNLGTSPAHLASARGKARRGHSPCSKGGFIAPKPRPPREIREKSEKAGVESGALLTGQTSWALPIPQCWKPFSAESPQGPGGLDPRSVAAPALTRPVSQTTAWPGWGQSSPPPAPATASLPGTVWGHREGDPV